MSQQERIEQLESLVDCLNEQVQRLQQFVADLDTDEVPCDVCGHRTTGHICLCCENLTLQTQLEESRIEFEARRTFDLQPSEN